MRMGNVVKWAGDYWIVATHDTGVVGKDYTERATLISLQHSNMSTGLTDKEETGFAIRDATVVGESVVDYVNNNLTDLVWRKT